ncbi:MAG: flavodoxin family protein [Clostridia bacterium]|nr:flavodoxin family protein [Clostridia bacterium]
MKIILLNGSPREKGCTYTALCEAERILKENGSKTEIVQLSKGPVQGCIGCSSCRATGRCVFEDEVSSLGNKVAEADGLIIGSPVYFGGMAGSLKAALDRLFYSGAPRFAGKPAAAIVCARRGGLVTAYEDMNRYFEISNMPVVTSQYWNQVHASTPQEVAKDEEGMQTLRTLARNMVWLIRCIQSGKEQGIHYPEHEKRLKTNFIR